MKHGLQVQSLFWYIPYDFLWVHELTRIEASFWRNMHACHPRSCAGNKISHKRSRLMIHSSHELQRYLNLGSRTTHAGQRHETTTSNRLDMITGWPYSDQLLARECITMYAAATPKLSTWSIFGAWNHTHRWYMWYASQALTMSDGLPAFFWTRKFFSSLCVHTSLSLFSCFNKLFLISTQQAY
jgi:hypothetical protein